MKKLFNFLTITGISLSVIMPVKVQAARISILDNQQLHEYLAITQINYSILKRMNSPTTHGRHIDNSGKYFQFPTISAVPRGFARSTPGISVVSHRQKSLHDRPSYQHQLFVPPPEFTGASLDINSPRSYHGNASGHDSLRQYANQRFMRGSSGDASTHTPLSISDNISEIDLAFLELISQPDNNNISLRKSIFQANKPCCHKENSNLAAVPEPVPINLTQSAFLLLAGWQWLTVRKKQGNNRNYGS